MLTKDCKKQQKIYSLSIDKESGYICLGGERFDMVSGNLLKVGASGSHEELILRDAEEIYRISYCGGKGSRGLGNEFMNVIQALADRAEEITPETRIVISMSPESGLRVDTSFEEDIKPSKNLAEEISNYYDKGTDSLEWIKAHFLLEDAATTINRRVVVI